MFSFAYSNRHVTPDSKSISITSPSLVRNSGLCSIKERISLSSFWNCISIFHKQCRLNFTKRFDGNKLNFAIMIIMIIGESLMPTQPRLFESHVLGGFDPLWHGIKPLIIQKQFFLQTYLVYDLLSYSSRLIESSSSKNFFDNLFFTICMLIYTIC